MNALLNRVYFDMQDANVPLICCVEHSGFTQPQKDEIAPQSTARVICKCRRAATEIPQVLKVPRTCNLHLLLQLKKIRRQMQTASSA